MTKLFLSPIALFFAILTVHAELKLRRLEAQIAEMKQFQLTEGIRHYVDSGRHDKEIRALKVKAR